MKPTVEMSRGRAEAAIGLAAAAVLVACLSAHYLYRSVAPPLEVYDNERSLLAMLYSIPALILAVGSLFASWPARSKVFALAKVAATSVIIYALALVVVLSL